MPIREMVWVALVYLGLQANVSADLVIMNIGDSVSAANTHRVTLHNDLESLGIAHTFVGDVKVNAYDSKPLDFQAYGGASFSDMLIGRTVDRGSGPNFEAGVQDALTRYSPNTFLILGGYNNMVGEIVGGGLLATKVQYATLIDFIVANVSSAKIYVSNITDFDPSSSFGPKRPNITEWNSYLVGDTAQRRAAGQSVFLVDNFSSLTYADLRSDGLHPDTPGQIKIGNNWAKALTATPEPSSVLLLTGCCATFLFRRRRNCCEVYAA